MLDRGEKRGGRIESTKENCETYLRALGVNVTPHPILVLPALP